MLFRILHGDESRISTDITPFHEGWAYVTTSGNYYVDMNIGTVEAPNNQRIKLNAKDAETIAGVSLDELKTFISNQDAVVLAEAQNDASNKDALILAEAQQYTDNAIANIKISEGFSGSYNDLTDKPEIPTVPTNIGAFENDVGYLTSVPSEYVTETYVDNKIADLVNSAPEALNTLGELATALENHEDAYDALLETVGNKATKTELEDVKNTTANYAAVVLAEVQNRFATKEDLSNIELTPGADGISATHSWNGTTLTITSTSGTSSADLKGEQGNPGYTPVRGTDFWTEADKEEMKAYIRSYIEEVLLGGKW